MANFDLQSPAVLRQITALSIGPVNFFEDNLVNITLKGNTADGASLAEWTIPIRNAAAGAGASGMLVRCPDPIIPGGAFQVIDAGPTIPLGHLMLLIKAGVAAAIAAGGGDIVSILTKLQAGQTMDEIILANLQSGADPAAILLATHTAVIDDGRASGWIHPGVFSGEVYVPPAPEPPPEEPAP